METKTFYITYKVEDGEISVPIVCNKKIYEHIDNHLTNHIESPVQQITNDLISYHAALLGLDPDNGSGQIYFPGEGETVLQDTFSLPNLSQ